MTERINHAAEARQRLAVARQTMHGGLGEPSPSPRAAAALDEAQVHATLALFEQQRIANLIAYVAKWTDDEVLDIDEKIREGLEL